MNNDIIDIVVNTPEPEHAGSRTQNRYDFQNHWIVCHLLELHQEGVDFILAAECHDDVLEIRPACGRPLRFFQIKTTQQPIKLSAKNTTTSMTYLGKLLCHVCDFGEDKVELLTLVSDKNFDARLENNKYAWGVKDFSLEEMPVSSQHEIWNAATSFLPTKDMDLKFNPKLLSFKVTDLSVDSFEATTKGKITTFLEKYSKEKAAIPFYKALIAEIRRQASHEYKVPSRNDFLNYRSISKDGFDEIIKTVINKPIMDESIKKIDSFLNSDKVTFGIRRKYLKALQEIEIDRYAKNSYLMLLERKVDEAYQKSDLDSSNFIDTINCIYNSIVQEPLVAKILQDKQEIYIKAIIALRIVNE